jgi:anti-sigma factor RsiW
MNCSEWEERIALYAGGDASPSEAAAVERHLAECVACQVLSSGLKQSLELLREAHQEPLAEAHFAAVRARVMGRLESRQRPWWKRAWVYGFTAAAAGALILASLYTGPHLVQTPRTPVAIVTPAPVLAPPRVEAPAALPAPLPVAVAPHRLVPRRPSPAPPTVNPAGPEMVKLMTDDPDVVIYWLFEKRGE